jgi:hypothetical protein
MKKLADIQEGLWLMQDPIHGRHIALQDEDRLYFLCKVPREGEATEEAAPLKDAVHEIIYRSEAILDDNFGEIMQGIFDYLKERYSW